MDHSTTASRIPTIADPSQLTPTFLQEALGTVGAMRIERALDKYVTRLFLEVAGAAFRIEEPIKEQCRRAHAASGYTPPGVERVVGHDPDTLRHFWDIGRNARAPHQAVEPLYALGTELWLQLCDVAGQAIACFDRAYGTEVLAGAQGGNHLLRISEYLNEEASSSDVLFPPHADFGLLTLYIGGSSAGLQVLIKDTWYDVWNPPGSVIFGVGTTLCLHAPGHIRALRHRVMGSSLGRISSVYFTEPRAEFLLPNGSTWGDHLAGLLKKVRAN